MKWIVIMLLLMHNVGITKSLNILGTVYKKDIVAIVDCTKEYSLVQYGDSLYGWVLTDLIGLKYDYGMCVWSTPGADQPYAEYHPLVLPRIEKAQKYQEELRLKHEAETRAEAAAYAKKEKERRDHINYIRTHGILEAEIKNSFGHFEYFRVGKVRYTFKNGELIETMTIY